ncbi:MAG: hypothetical protein ACYCZM_15120 [Acidimicrobiales bacterium]
MTASLLLGFVTGHAELALLFAAGVAVGVGGCLLVGGLRGVRIVRMPEPSATPPPPQDAGSSAEPPRSAEPPLGGPDTDPSEAIPETEATDAATTGEEGRRTDGESNSEEGRRTDGENEMETSP